MFISISIVVCLVKAIIYYVIPKTKCFSINNKKNQDKSCFCLFTSVYNQNYID